LLPVLTRLRLADGIAGAENATGDQQKKLDVLSNDMLTNSLYNSHTCAILVSEETEEPIIVPEELAGTRPFLVGKRNHWPKMYVA
jgi:fructose-1,6-bisphosphatase